MVKREVPFGNSSLLFTWRNLNAFFEAFGIETLEDYDKFFSTEGTKKLGFSDIGKMVYFGLQRRDKQVSLEEANDILDGFTEEKTLQDALEIIIKAQMSAMVSSSAGELKGETVKQTKPPRQSKS